LNIVEIGVEVEESMWMVSLWNDGVDAVFKRIEELSEIGALANVKRPLYNHPTSPMQVPYLIESSRVQYMFFILYASGRAAISSA